MPKKQKTTKSDQLLAELSVKPLYNDAEEYIDDVDDTIDYTYNSDSDNDTTTVQTPTVKSKLRANSDLDDLQQKYKGKKVTRAELYHSVHTNGTPLHTNGTTSNHNDTDISSDSDHNNTVQITKSILSTNGKQKRNKRSVSFANDINRIKEFYITDIVQTPVKPVIKPVEIAVQQSDSDNDQSDESDNDSITSTVSESSDDETNDIAIASSDSDIDSETDEQINQQAEILHKQLQAVKQQQQQAQTKSLQLLSTTQELEQQKSVALNAQNNVYNQLIALRIKLQSVVNTANVLPASETVQQICSENTEIDALYNNARNGVESLLNNMLQAQTTWFHKVDDLSHVTNEHTPVTDANSAYDQIDTIHQNTEQWCHELIDKWNNKVQSTSLQSLQNKQLQLINNSLVKQIQQQYNIEQNRLIQQSHIYISNTNNKQSLLGRRKRTDTDNYSDPYIYNDIDMYQSILHDIIAVNNSNGTTTNNKLHTYKTKQKVDTRATKGRKIKYVVIPKLVAFMAPVQSYNDDSTIVDQLFSGLFGGK